MHKVLISLGVTLVLGVTSLYADALSHSLNNMLKSHDSSGMVNLNNISLNGKPKRKPLVRPPFKGRPGKTIIGHYHNGKSIFKRDADKYIRKVTKGKIKDLDMLPKKQRFLVLKDLQKIYKMTHFKSRSDDAMVATIDGRVINKREADYFLSKVTKGKVKDFDRLDKKQRLALIKDLAKPILLKKAVKNDITTLEKEEIFREVWLAKQRRKIHISNEEMLALYNNKKEQALAKNPQAMIPSYISMGVKLKNEIFDTKIMKMINKDMNISINYDNQTPKSRDDSNNSLEKLDKISKIKG